MNQRRCGNLWEGFGTLESSWQESGEVTELEPSVGSQFPPDSSRVLGAALGYCQLQLATAPHPTHLCQRKAHLGCSVRGSGMLNTLLEQRSSLRVALCL